MEVGKLLVFTIRCTRDIYTPGPYISILHVFLSQKAAFNMNSSLAGTMYINGNEVLRNEQSQVRSTTS